MNVSFGSIVEKYEGPNCRKRYNQVDADKIIDEYFDTRDEKKYGYNIVSSPSTLAEKVDFEMGADVVIKYNINGDIKMSLQESEDQKIQLKEYFGIENVKNWLSKEAKTPIILKAKDSLENIRKTISDYAEKCLQQAKNFDTAKIYEVNDKEC